MQIPLSVDADFYSISSDLFAGKDAKDYSCYNFTNRRSPADAFPELAQDSRMVLYGVEEAVNEVFRPVTEEDVEETALFMARSHSFGGGLPFNKEMWLEVAKMGKLPLKVTALKDGSVFFPNEPVVHVENTIEGFGELAVHIEANLVGLIANATSAATLCRHYLNKMKEEVKKDHILLGYRTDDETLYANARFQIHNFGKRAAKTPDSSLISGLAHLLSFYGSDNANSCFAAWKMGAVNPVGTSILALAHHSVMSHNSEIDAFNSIGDATLNDEVRIVSCVADCYNYASAVESIVKLAIERPDIIWVVRPDSGDCFETIHTIFLSCITHGVYREINGFIIPKNVRFIYGDSVKPKMHFEVWDRLRTHGMLPTLWGVTGIGGHLYNTPTRDSLSSAYKLCVKGQKKEGVVKLSEVTGKLSIPFKNSVRPYTVSNKGNVAPTVYPYSHAMLVNEVEYTDYIEPENFMTVSNRAIQEFDAQEGFAKENPNFGLNRETLCDEIKDFQDEFYKKYRSVQ